MKHLPTELGSQNFTLMEFRGKLRRAVFDNKLSIYFLLLTSSFAVSGGYWQVWLCGYPVICACCGPGCYVLAGRWRPHQLCGGWRPTACSSHLVTVTMKHLHLLATASHLSIQVKSRTQQYTCTCSVHCVFQLLQPQCLYNTSMSVFSI